MGKHIHQFAFASETKTVLVFVAGRRQAKLTCVDLVAYSLTEGEDEDHDLELDDPYLGECVKRGIGYIHEGSSHNDYEKMRNGFGKNIRVLVISEQMCWRLNDLRSDMVVLADTVSFNPISHSYEDYPMCNILEMCGRAAKEALVLCHSSKVDYLQKFLFDPLPIESCLFANLHDQFNAEIVARTIENKQDAVDYLTWTLMYRRMTQNPNYYNLAGLSHRHLSDHLSQMVEGVLNDLQECKCILVQDLECTPLNLAMIATYYYTTYRTIELFSRTLNPKTKSHRTLLELISSATEFDEQLTIRHGEEALLKQLKVPKINSQNDLVCFKAISLIYAHLARINLPGELSTDAAFVARTSVKLLHVCIDILSSNGWLSPVIVAMETVQMVVQAVWPDEKKKPLRQIPHFTHLIDKCAAAKVESVFDLMEMDDDARNELFSDLNKRQIGDIARFCNAYPNIEFSFKGKAHVGENIIHHTEYDEELLKCPKDGSITLSVRLQKEQDELCSEVVAPFFPSREEGWWVVIGEPSENRLLAIKRIMMRNKTEVTADMEVTNPLIGKEDRRADLKVYLMSDSYIGCDQEYQLSVERDC